MMTEQWTYALKVAISNRFGVHRDFKEWVTSNESLSSDELRKIAAEIANDLYPDWCLASCEVIRTERKFLP
jgi:hypothetical protein